MNRIRQVVVRNRVLDPASSELWVTISLERWTATTEVRGRLMGPRCPYATTVEVAYPLRQLPGMAEGVPECTRRVLIPEASFWDPVSPFLYQGPVELWEGGGLQDTVQVSHGLRVLTSGPAGLRLNNRPLALRGVARDSCSEQEAVALHRGGVNLLLAPATPATAALWDVAGRYGFLVLGRLPGADEEAVHLAATSWCWRPSCLGWLLAQDVLDRPGQWDSVRQRLLRGRNILLGVELERPPAGPLPQEISFVAGPEKVLASWEEADLPQLIVPETPKNGKHGAKAQSMTEARTLLGWIE
jgi:hypothetical protein